MSLSRNCLILGDDSEKAFTVEIPKNESIYALGEEIPSPQPPDLDLWQVSIPIDNLRAELGNINRADDHHLFPLSTL